MSDLAHYHWHQPLLVPIPVVTMRLNVHLDGPRAMLQLGWEAWDPSTESRLALGTSEEYCLRHERPKVLSVVDDLVELGLGSLSPF